MSQYLSSFFSNKSVVHVSTGTATTISPTDNFLKDFFTLINDNIDRQLPVGFLARELAVSRSTLNRKLAVLTGLPVTKIIKQYRLQKAAELLLSGRTVTETAYLTGFETPSYFIQCFKELYKQTPKKYVDKNACTSPIKIDEQLALFYQIRTA